MAWTGDAIEIIDLVKRYGRTTAIDGLTTYLRSGEERTFGPYFSATTVGRLVAETEP